MPANYCCRHDAHTVLLQKIHDHDQNFLDMCVLAPGDTHDATYLKKSSLYKEHMENTI